MQKRTVILGGGITGLSAAYYLQKTGAKNITLIEAGTPGGKINTLQSGHFLVEAGPDSFITAKPHAVDLCEELGLGNEIIQPKTSAFHILKDGKMLNAPEGLRMMVPTNIDAFMQSELFTEDGKKRTLQEKDIPAKEDDADESFGSFITRRFGSEMLTNYAEPLFGGIYATPSFELSMLATFPQLLQMEKKFGSITAAITQAAAQPGAPDNRSPFVSLKNGIYSLVEALVKSLQQAEIVKKSIKSLYMAPSKNAYTIGLEDGTSIEADRIIMALPLAAARSLIKNISAEAAEILGGFSPSGSKIITLAYNKKDIGADVNATGFVAVRNPNQKITASTWSSEKWPYRAPEDVLLARLFYKGGGSNLPDAEEAAAAHAEFSQLLDIKENPIQSWCFRWQNALPQYKLGHLERVKQLEQTISQLPGFALAGAYMSGVGIPDCIRQGKEAAETILL